MGILNTVAKRILGSQHLREAKNLQPLVDEINQIYAEYEDLSESEFKGKTSDFRARIKATTSEVTLKIDQLQNEKRNAEEPERRQQLQEEIAECDEKLLTITQEILSDILPEAFATVKEACRRLIGTEVVVSGQKQTWDMIPYDVQLIGGIALHRGKAAEMGTGEGKTLVATMPLYLNALVGRGAHLVTVNPYLAQRDSEWMGIVYNYLGLTVDCIDKYEPHSPGRVSAYRADITYGTNNEFGFDYLRDNMVHSLDQRVQPRHWYSIIDEVDSILIDEARTPLIISGPVGNDTATPFKQYNRLVGALYQKQTRLVSQLIADGERDLEQGDDFSAGEKLLAAKRGGPRNKRLMKIFSEDPGIQKLVLKVEADYMREKRLYEIDELLFFAMDEKGQNVHLSDSGLDELAPGDPEAFVIPDLSEMLGELEADDTLSGDQKRELISEVEAEYASKSEKMHVIHQLLKAYTLFQKDEKYIIGEDGNIVIVDEFTGRQMSGRRWSDGLHQAVEAKEGVEIKGETQTLATITIQNYFRMYDKLAGMTGTAETEETEFHEIYKLDVFVIPTNRPIIREDREDLIFRTKREKYHALIDEIERLNKMELPVLVGTTNVEISETLSRMIKRRGIVHNVLNAKQHKKESEIVAEAGRPGAVTIATNMAGRGTDIKLGEGVTEPRTVAWARSRGLNLEDLASVDPAREWNLEKENDDYVIEVGGLHILGSERHESRRIDRQLRGRSGRQGDPGATRFFISVEDDLMRLFVGDRLASLMDKFGATEGEVITHRLVTRSIETAQRRVEGNNFEARKRLLDYDDVMNQQREVVYDLRLFALEGGEDLKGEMWEMIEHSVEDTLNGYLDDDYSEDLDLEGLKNRLTLDYFTLIPDHRWSSMSQLDSSDITNIVLEAVRLQFEQKIEGFGVHAEAVTSYIMLSIIDSKWKDHLYDLDHLKASIGFRGWGQKDPLVEYKKEAYDMFVDLMGDLKSTVANLTFKAQLGDPNSRVSGQSQGLNYSGPSRGSNSQFGDVSSSPARALGRSIQGSSDEVRPPPGVIGGQFMNTEPQKVSTNRNQDAVRTPVTADKTPGRNDACPCGSGKKYKKCHGRGLA